MPIPTWASAGVVALLMVSYVAGYADSASIQDTARDVYYAFAIRHGLFLPLEGPILGGAIHLGPAWFYLLSIPLWAWESWLAVAIFAGLLGSLKFPLALACGTKLLDREFGLLWAVCLAIPGWASFEMLIFFNPNAAAAIVLLALYLALRVLDRAPRDWESASFGFACALALHVHPTTAPAAALGLVFIRGAQRAGASPARPLLLMLAGFAAPFLPYLASQWAQGFPDWRGASGYVDSQVRLSSLGNLPLLEWAYFIHGPKMLATHIAGWPQAAGVALAAISVAPLAALALCFPALIGHPRARRTFALMALCALAFSAWIVALRPTTPVYFVFALAPFAAGLVALGLWLVARLRLGRGAVALFAVLAVAAGGAMVVRMASIVRHGEGVLTSQVLDIKEGIPRQTYTETWFPASGRHALGRLLCSQPAGTILHGHLAYVVDRSVGVDAWLACGSVRQVSLLGGTPGSSRHWVGMSRQFWSQLNSRSACRIGSLGLVAATGVHWPQASLSIPDGKKYFPRDHGRSPPRENTVAFEAPASDALLVTNVLHGYESFGPIRVQANDQEVVPISRNDLSALYASPGVASGGATAWVVSFVATNPDGVDIVTFPHRPGNTPPEGCP